MSEWLRRVPWVEKGDKLSEDSYFLLTAPNRYSLPGMIGHTVQSGKRQAPCISVRGRSNIGSFSEDMSKVW